MEVMDKKYLTVRFMQLKKKVEAATKSRPVLFFAKTAYLSGRYMSKKSALRWDFGGGPREASSGLSETEDRGMARGDSDMSCRDGTWRSRWDVERGEAVIKCSPTGASLDKIWREQVESRNASLVMGTGYSGGHGTWPGVYSFRSSMLASTFP